ncbi:hypothetical protein [Metabacillus sp. RGM 3146]|uniref:hypothetical protein n=1 Tax=Metabacillus sp. RGM 3146 TaxID=3401092 RepID=UPI003B9912B0
MKPIFFRLIGIVFLLQIPLWLGIVNAGLLIIIGAIGLLIIFLSNWLSGKSLSKVKSNLEEKEDK